MRYRSEIAEDSYINYRIRDIGNGNETTSTVSEERLQTIAYTSIESLKKSIEKAFQTSHLNLNLVNPAVVYVFTLTYNPDITFVTTSIKEAERVAQDKIHEFDKREITNVSVFNNGDDILAVRMVMPENPDETIIDTYYFEFKAYELNK